jgi:hypothetical protein
MYTARLIFYILFILLNFTVLGIVDNLQKQDKCQCNTGWKPENLKLISQIGIFIGFINIILPINKTLYSIPLINTAFSILCLCVILMYFFTMVRYFRNLRQLDKCRNTCKIKKTDETFINIVSNTNTTLVLLVGVITTVLTLYL